MVDAASISAYASVVFGSHAATRSPGPTPAARNACCSRDTSACSSRQVVVRRSPSSRANRIAGLSSSRRRRFSAKLRVASGKNRVRHSSSSPGCSITRSPASPATSKCSQTERQNCSGCPTDHACSAAYPSISTSQRARAAAAKAVRLLDPMRAADGAHSGSRSVSAPDIGRETMAPQ